MADELNDNQTAATMAPVERYFELVMGRFNALPAPIRDYLNASSTAERLRQTYQEANLTQDEREIAYAIVLKVFFGMVKPNDFADVLWTELGWPETEEQRCSDLAVNLIGRVLLPAQVFLGDLTPVLLEFGGKVEDFPNEQIELRVLSFDAGAKEVAASVTLPLSQDDRVRLQHIVASRLRDVRDELETREMLTRSKKVGGLEMEPASVEHILNVLREKAMLTRYVEYVDDGSSARDSFGPTAPLAAAEMPTADMSVTVTPAGETGQPSVESDAEPQIEPQVEPEIQLSEEIPAPSVAQPLTPADIKAIYNGSEEERAGLARRIAKFKEVTGGEAMRERDAFYEILYPPDLGPVEPQFVAAAVMALAEDGNLVTMLAEDLRIREIVNKFLVDQQQQAAAFRFAENPSDPEFMNVFLQLALRAFAGLPDSEAARFGLRASRALAKGGYTEYDGFVAFDSDLRAFRWLMPIDL